MFLITGATGTIGRAVLARFGALDINVRAMSRDPQSAAHQVGSLPHVEWVYGDLAAPDTLAPTLAGVQRALLLSAAGPRQVELQQNFIEAAEDAGIEHVVKISALAAAADAPFAAGRQHARIEAALARCEFGVTNLRPHVFMQNFLKSAATIRDPGTIFAPMGDARISLVDARDVAAVAAAVLCEAGRHAGQSYDITGPEALSYADIAAQLSEVLGRPIRYVEVTPSDARRAMLGRSMPPWLVENILALQASLCTGQWSEATQVVSAITGAPARRFIDFARDHRDAFAPRRPQAA
ncbi:NmrA family NAD(P)-binding protein [Haliangium sp.]|uniref:NmrA family NAD(P)-binding protein n=1 Tax=Haliangium sp. TaxID=2663208 RepID=UPI003D1412E5